MSGALAPFDRRRARGIVERVAGQWTVDYPVTIGILVLQRIAGVAAVSPSAFA